MRNGPDTGEFVAISVSHEQPRIQAAQLAERVSALSQLATDLAERNHNNHYVTNGCPENWRDCNLVTCRRARAVIDGKFSEHPTT